MDTKIHPIRAAALTPVRPVMKNPFPARPPFTDKEEQHP
jgi:hypothetical protein